MQSAEFRVVFPADFVKRKETEFVYYAFAGSMKVSQRGYLWGLRRVMPPSSWSDRGLLFLFQQLHQVSKAVLLCYTRRGTKSIRWSEEEGTDL